MSFAQTSFRRLARGGWGGKAASHFRGASSSRRVPRGQIGTVIYRSPSNTRFHTLIGVSRDSAQVPLAGCEVHMFRTLDEAWVAMATSDGSGNFTLTISGPGGPFYLVAYKPGAPDVAGTTVNTLVAG